MTNPQIIRALRLMNMEKNGTPTVAEFEALLTDQGRVDAFAELLARPGVLHQLAAYPNLSSALSVMATTRADVMRVVSRSPAAMLSLIADQAALSTIFASADVLAAFRASTALAKASVPKMTSNTSPSGVASASSWYSGEYSSWKAFDGTGVASYWSAAGFAGASGEWIQYSFPGEAFIHSASIHTHPSPYNPTSVGIWHSDDGVVFTLAGEYPVVAESINTLRILTPGFHKHWRLVVKATGGGAFPALHELNFTGFVKP